MTEETVKNIVENITANIINAMNLNKPVYTRNETLQLLGLDSKTLKRYQDDGLIGYSQPIDGGKVFFSRQDIDEFLNRTHHEAFYFNGL